MGTILGFFELMSERLGVSGCTNKNLRILESYPGPSLLLPVVKSEIWNLESGIWNSASCFAVFCFVRIVQPQPLPWQSLWSQAIWRFFALFSKKRNSRVR